MASSVTYNEGIVILIDSTPTKEEIESLKTAITHALETTDRDQQRSEKDLAFLKWFGDAYGSRPDAIRSSELAREVPLARVLLDILV